MGKVIGFIAVVVVIVGGGLLLVSNKGSANTQNLEPATVDEYFWSTTCPHCAELNQFLDGWEHTSELKLNKYEVGNTQNALRLQTRAISCNIPRSQIGVPMIYTTEGKCVVGTEPIISYFESLFDNEESN